jgi:hypothetical protein
VVGGIYSPQPPHSRGGRLMSMGASPDTVQCASHVTQPLGFGHCRPLEALSSSGTGQVLFTVRCASSDCFDFYAQCLLTVSLTRAFAVDRCAEESFFRWCTGQSGGTPDSMVNYSRARSEKIESG